jgi:hypothetical protein
MQITEAHIGMRNLRGSTLRFILLVSMTLIVSMMATFLALGENWLWLVVIVGIGVALLLLIMRPSTTLLLAFAFLPFQSLINDVFARNFSSVAVGKDVLMVIAILSLIVHYLSRRQGWYLNSTLVLLLLFGVAGALYTLVAPYWLRAVLQLRFFTLYPLIILVVANGLETTSELRKVLRLVAVLGLVTVIYGLLQYLFLFDVPYRTGGGDVALRMDRFGELGIVSTFASRPTFGGYLVAIFLLFYQVKLWNPGRAGWLFRVLALGSIFACLVLTYSRSSWLALLVGMFVALYCQSKIRAAGGLLAAGFCLMMVYGTQSLSLSPTLTEAVTSGESFRARLSYWPLVLRHTITNPFGIGLGMVGGPHLFEGRAQSDIYGNLQYDPSTLFNANAELGPDNTLSVTDNSYLKILIQGGFPLMLIFLSLLGSIIWLASSVLKSVADPWLRDLAVWASASFASLLTMFMFVDFMEAAPAISIYWLAVGALCFVKRLSADGTVSKSGSRVPALT